MTTLYCHVATTQRQLDDALRVRWAVFGEELRLIDGPGPAVPREVNCFDTLETTVHLVVYADHQPVATTRLLLPNSEVAHAMDGRLGIDLEQKLDLSGVGGPGLCFAESTRFCILKPWRNSEVLLRLQAGLYQESWRRGVTHWIASANTETDSVEDVHVLYRVAAHQGLVSHRWRVLGRASSKPPAIATAPLYTPAERARARHGLLEGLRLPRTLSLFAHKMGARFIGEPIYDAHFRRFSMPLVAALAEIPSSTLTMFSAVESGAHSAV
ncbi:GNAT family N-acetyltransferase [Hyalangium rubrum]|uniref:GNAT family N-acetyltransferase n=1 Tax=Hyalangium rubrum TaxID=3103134 RepID=A0ABU5GZ52_9BACT|nr:GNAT family N-acetyltransferase [Hyalangium sp. s54d21]MDY7226476.1 GNAT family N-acetyltransferase [Hyalangium sp. s54d21]